MTGHLSWLVRVFPLVEELVADVRTPFTVQCMDGEEDRKVVARVATSTSPYTIEGEGTVISGESEGKLSLRD